MAGAREAYRMADEAASRQVREQLHAEAISSYPGVGTARHGRQGAGQDPRPDCGGAGWYPVLSWGGAHGR